MACVLLVKCLVTRQLCALERSYFYRAFNAGLFVEPACWRADLNTMGSAADVAKRWKNSGTGDISYDKKLRHYAKICNLGCQI